MIISKLSEKEKEVFGMFLNRNEIIKFCNNFFFSIHRQIAKYDPKDLMFTILEDEWEEVTSPDTPLSLKTYDGINQTILMTAEEIKSYFDNEIEVYMVNNKTTPDLKDKFKNKLAEKIKKLVKLCHRIEFIKSKERTNIVKVGEMAEAYQKYIPSIHASVIKTQEELKSFLLQIIDSERGYESEFFKSSLWYIMKFQSPYMLPIKIII